MSGRVKLGERKRNIAISTIQEKVARALNVTLEEINLDTSTTEDVDLLRIKAENFDRLMQLIKEKLSTKQTNREIIQLLTLAPETWSIKKVAKSMLLVKLKVLFRKKGSWLYLTKKGKNLSQDTINLVKAFYEDDEFSRQMPKKINYVSVSRNTHKQKRLILSNLNELYANFKSKYVSISIGFSNICELRPKWCVLAGSSGTHSVCVCTYHQNMTLLLAALNVTYQELFPLIVCDINNKE